MNLVLFDAPSAREALKPFTYTKPIAELRVGILTMKEKWQHYLPGEYSYLTDSHLSHKFPFTAGSSTLCINAAVSPNEVIAEYIQRLKLNEKLVNKDETLIAIRCDEKTLEEFVENNFNHPHAQRSHYEGPIEQLKNKWHLFMLNDQELIKDFRWITSNRSSEHFQDLRSSIYNPGDIFIEEGASIQAAILDARLGPIYIGEKAIIQAGAIIQGPVAIAAEAQVRAGAKISNATTIGPGVRVGGEVSNSIIMGHSNKAHDGFLGHSVIGEWCNLGAGTNVSNLRNDYQTVTVWDYEKMKYVDSELQFCGLFMGDYSRCSINSMFNTGTVVGTASNLFGTGFPGRFIPAFTWGSDKSGESHMLDKAIAMTDRMMQRRSQQLTTIDHHILQHVYQSTAAQRIKENV